MTHDELIQVLRGRGAAAYCPSCGADRWTGLSEAEGSSALILVSGLGEGALEGIGVVGLSCGNCGFVRLHRRDTLGLE